MVHEFLRAALPWIAMGLHGGVLRMDERSVFEGGMR